MGRRKLSRRLICVVLVVLFGSSAFAGDPLSRERGIMKLVCKQVSSEMQNKFYDPDLKGLNWSALTEEAQQKIDNAKSVGEMMTAVHVLVSKLDDSHTAFIPPGRNVSYKFGYSAKAFGDEFRVFALKTNGAAEKAGLKIGDVVLKINGFQPTRRNFRDMMYYFKIIRNASELTLTVKRGDESPFDVKIEGEKKEAAVHAQALDMIWDIIREYDKQATWHSRSFDGVGYAQIRGFTFEGSDFMSGIIDASVPSKAIILDFRSNGGGSEDTLKEFAGMFETEERKLADIVGRKKTEEIFIKPRRPHYTQPLFILIDSDTGSAAEMFARHFQRTGRAVLIGDRTAGAVTRAMGFGEQVGANTIIPYATYIGVGKVVFPDGEVLEKNGVKPDVPCIPSTKDVADERDPCLLLAVRMARKAAGLKEDNNLENVRAIVDRD